MRAPAAWAGSVTSAAAREWMADALSRRRELPPDPGPGGAYLSLSLPRRAVRALEAVTGDTPSVALRRVIAAYRPALPAPEPARLAAPLPAVRPAALAPAPAIPEWLQPRPAANLPVLRAPSGLPRTTADGWTAEQVALYRAAHDSNRHWADRQAALNRLSAHAAGAGVGDRAATVAQAASDSAGALANGGFSPGDWFAVLTAVALVVWLVWAVLRTPPVAAARPADPPAFKDWAPVAGGAQ
ncbi:MAG: hypothetical protein ACRD2F_02050 [Terriglobales bacterium]